MRLSAEERKKEILVGAMRVFARKGFDGATSKELAAAAGVSEALIYKYFPTKESLYRELTSLFSGNRDRVIAQLTSGEPGSAAFIRAFYILGRLILFGVPTRPKDDSVDRLIGQSLLGDGSFAAAFFESLFYPLLPYLSECLVAAKSTGEIDAVQEPTALTPILFHHLVGVIALFSLPEQPLLPVEDGEVLFEETFRFGLRGVGFTEAVISNRVETTLLMREFQAMFSAPV